MADLKRLVRATKQLRSDMQKSRKFRDPTLSARERGWLWKNGFFPLEKRMYGLTSENLHRYVDQRSYRRLHPLNGRFSKLIDDKGALPVIVAHAPSVNVVVDRGVVRYAVGVDRTRALRDLRERIDGGGELFLRPVGRSGGEGAVLLNAGNFDEVMAGIVREKKTAVVTCKVVQHAYAASIFPGSVNTVRALFMRDPDSGRIFLAAASHRFGTSETAPVDNGGVGGLAAPIDTGTGRIGKALRYARGFGWHTHHPDTGAPIEGTVIPAWQERARAMTEAFDALNWLDFAGADICLTDEGFTVIEINSLPGLELHQIAGPLLTDERIRRFFDSKGLRRARHHA